MHIYAHIYTYIHIYISSYLQKRTSHNACGFGEDEDGVELLNKVFKESMPSKHSVINKTTLYGHLTDYSVWATWQQAYLKGQNNIRVCINHSLLPQGVWA
jgi:glutaredoxin-related protein